MEFHGGPKKRKRRKPADPEWLAFMSDDEKEEERIRGWQSVSLADVGLPVRVVNTLEECGVLTVGHLANRTEEQLRAIPNLGEITVKKCRKLLNDLQIPARINDEQTSKESGVPDPGSHPDAI